MQPLFKKISYIFSLIVNTPYFGWIIILQIISGFASAAGIPLLIPVLEYMQNGTSGGSETQIAIINNILQVFEIQPSFKLLLIMAFILIVIGQGLIFLSVVLAQYAQLKISGRYRVQLMRAYANVDWLWMTSDDSGKMNNAVLREADLAGVAHLDSQRIVIYLVQAFVYLFLLLRLSFPVTIIALIVYCVLSFINSKNTFRVQLLSKKYNEQFKDLSSTVTGFQQNKKFIKASSLPGVFVERINLIVTAIIQSMHLTNIREQLQLSWSMVIPLFFLFSLLFFHNELNLTLPQLFVLLIVFQRLSPQFVSLFSAYTALHKNIPVHESISERMNSLSECRETSGSKDFEFDASIQLKQVGFSYPNGERIFTNLNLVIVPNQTIGFVGGSGAGKSTLLDLILGLLKPNGGNILYGNINHNDLNIDGFRKHIAYVSQETTLLNGTIKDNLTIGCPKATEEEINLVCEQIQLKDFLNSLSEGLETQVGENGIKLSGGQKQRITLGRALLFHPKLLVLDEATSDLDVETEMLIQNAIKKLRHSMTIIIVAHRLKTVKSADKIYVIEKGEICENGDYDELMKKQGRLYYLNSI